jgi:hypothetical protein
VWVKLVGRRIGLLNMALLKRLHINRQILAQNRKLKKKKPPVSIKTSHGNTKTMRAYIDGPSALVYSPDKPLNCGAVLWIETRAKVKTASGKIIE